MKSTVPKPDSLKIPVYRSLNEEVAIEIYPDGSVKLLIRNPGMIVGLGNGTSAFIESDIMMEVVQVWLGIQGLAIQEKAD